MRDTVVSAGKVDAATKGLMHLTASVDDAAVTSYQVIPSEASQSDVVKPAVKGVRLHIAQGISVECRDTVN